MRRVLAEELSAMRIPQRYLDELDEGLLEQLQFLRRDVIEQEVLLGILLLIFREEPEIIIGVGHHVGQGGQVYGQFHVVRRTLVGHQPAHVFLEERLSPHHQMRKDGLISGVVAEMAVTREDIVHESRTAAPMTENEERVVLQGLVGQEFFVALVLQGSQRRKQTADSLGQPILVAVGRVNSSRPPPRC